MIVADYFPGLCSLRWCFEVVATSGRDLLGLTSKQWCYFYYLSQPTKV